MDENKKGFGIVLAGIVLGILFLSGAFSSLPAYLLKIVKIIGVGCLIVAGIVAVFVIASIVMAIKSAPQDEKARVKSDIASIVRQKEQEITRLKSKAAVAAMELKKVQKRMEMQGETENLKELALSYQKTVEELEERIVNTQEEIVDIRKRSEAALLKWNDAKEIQNANHPLEELEDEAQYEEDYANALQELDGVWQSRK